MARRTTTSGQGWTDADRSTNTRQVEASGLTSGRFRAGHFVADRAGRPVTAVRFAGGVCYLAADGSVLAIDRDDP